MSVGFVLVEMRMLSPNCGRKNHVMLFARDVHMLGTFDGIDDSHVLHDKGIQGVQVLEIVVNVKEGATKTCGGYGEV